MCAVFFRGGAWGWHPTAGLPQPPTGRASCCPSVCHADTSWACRTHHKAKAGGECPAANMVAAGGFPHPPLRQPSLPWGHPAPQSKMLAVGWLRRGRLSRQCMAALPAWQPPSPAGPELGLRWSRQGKRVARLRPAQVPGK